MAKEIRKQTAETEYIEKEALTEEMYLIIKDTFVGTTEKGDGEIFVRFLNGQTFRIIVAEA